MASTEMIQISKAEYDELLAVKSKFDSVLFELAELKRLVFGSKSERFKSNQPDPMQTSLFADGQVETLEEAPKEEITYTREKPSKEKKQPLRTPLPAHLPRRKR
jgi:hypothetical protein